MDIFCSTIIPTINRPTLSHAVRSVLDQAFAGAGFEVIVVNDSGHPLPDMEWQHSERVRMIDTNCRERSVARNTGAAIARGKYLHFLDDDDLLLPGALDAFWALDREQGDDVIWLYGSYQTVDDEGNLVAEWHPGITGNVFGLLVAGESIPLPASLLQAKSFFAAGAFDPNLSYAEDRDLGRRINRLGDVAWAPSVVAELRIGEAGSSSDWSKRATSDRWGREKTLSTQGTFTRLRASATSSYLHGRVSRAYLASMVWNVEHKQLFIAASRAVACLAFIGWHPLSPEFWRGLRTKVK